MPTFCGTLSFHCYLSNNFLGKGSIAMLVRTEQFFETAPASFLQSLRRLQILSPLDVGQQEIDVISKRVRWCFDLRGRTRGSRVKFESANDLADRSLLQDQEHVKEGLGETMGAIRQALGDLADRILARPRPEFSREDADSIVKALSVKPARKEASHSEADQS
jgi:hypothetical protein